MRKIIINGGKKLQGEVTVSGAKNSVVALIPAIILSDGVVTLDGVPAISDVDNLIEIIEVMGGSVKRDGETLEIDPRGVKDMPMPFGKINSLRASYYFYGSLLGRYGQATVGCLVDVIWDHVLLTFTLRRLKRWVPAFLMKPSLCVLRLMLVNVFRVLIFTWIRSVLERPSIPCWQRLRLTVVRLLKMRRVNLRLLM